MHLSAVLGEPDLPHFPYPSPPRTFPPPTFSAPKKRKSPSQLRRQERRRKEALAKAEEAADTVERSGTDLSSEVVPEIIIEAYIEKPAVHHVEKADADNFPTFKCDQCAYTNATEKGLSQHIRMKHRISQVDGNYDSEEELLQTDENALVTEVEEVEVEDDHKCSMGIPSCGNPLLKLGYCTTCRWVG